MTVVRPRPLEGEVGAGILCSSLDDRLRDLPSCWLLRPTPRPSCRRRARTRTCAPRAPRHQRARGSSCRRTPGLARPGICTPCAGSSSDLTLQSGSPTVDLPCWRTLYASRAMCQLFRVHRIGPRVFTRHHLGPPTGMPASTRRTSHPVFPFRRRSEHERRAPPRIAQRPRAPLAPRALCPDGAVPLHGGRRRRCRKPSNCTPRSSRTTQATS